MQSYFLRSSNQHNACAPLLTLENQQLLRLMYNLDNDELSWEQQV